MPLPGLSRGSTVTGTSGDVETMQVTLSASLLSETKLFIRISAQTP